MADIFERRALLRRAFDAAVAAADPERMLAEFLPDPPSGDLIVIGAGKAAAAMARGVEARYRKGPAWPRLRGLVVTRYGHGGPGDRPLERIEVVEASHPVPDEAGLEATARILALAKDAGPDDMVLVLVSGGGSALLTAPRGVDLEQKRALTADLLASGATIQEMNVVRKHLSSVKGGRLAAAAHPAKVFAYVVSDVVGDDLAAIASGPTVPDPSTYADALEVLDRYGIEAPEARAHLTAGLEGHVDETPKPDTAALSQAETHIVASNQRSLEAAAEVLREGGFSPLILASEITGEARVAGQIHAAVVGQIARHGQPTNAPCAVLSGGETTVTVRGEGGRGGRNSEFALGLALALPAGLLSGGRVYALAADTDGIDGSEDNAGVFVGPDLFEVTPWPEARAALERNDSYGVFAAAAMLLETGPTGTNVNDLRMVLVSGEDSEA